MDYSQASRHINNKNLEEDKSMWLFQRRKLAKEIKKRKFECPYMSIWRIDGNCYYLVNRDNERYSLYINFERMKPMPMIGDGFYLSENMVNGIKENLRCFTSSTSVGAIYARPPHNFLKNPKEFLIFEYKNGRTILLEQWYG